MTLFLSFAYFKLASACVVINIGFHELSQEIPWNAVYKTLLHLGHQIRTAETQTVL